jgi:hypothetical protein
MFLTDDFGPVGWCGLHTSDAERAPLGQSEVESALPLPPVSVEIVDAVEIAEIIEFFADWLRAEPNHARTLFFSPDLYGAEDLAADLERLVNLIETAPIGP